MQKFQLKSLSFLFLLTLATGSFAQITTPRTPSPGATVAQTIGISTVTVKYSRPAVKGREIWGKLVPFGWNVQQFGAGNSAPWRAGANENTVVEFSHDVKVEGKSVPAGSYGLFFVINNDNTGEVILSKDYRSWGSFFYDAKQDQMKAPISLHAIPATELLTYEFTNITKNSAELNLNWETKQFPVKLEFAVDDLVLANAADELKGPIGFNWRGFSSAATYSLQNNVQLDKGMVWIDQAIAQNKAFPTLIIKSDILKKMGKTTESDQVEKDAIAASTEAELNVYGYRFINQKLFDRAIEILILNTQRFPKSANAWDSLGEAYALKGDKKNAIVNFKKSLTMNPPENVKVNSEKYLKELGAM